MPSRSVVYAQARKHAAVEKSIIEALVKTPPARKLVPRPRKAEEILPAHLWLRIFGFVDCNSLWSSCLHVSKIYRQCVESTFANDHICKSRTLITFHLGEETAEQVRQALGIELSFDKFSQDGSRATFKERVDGHRNPALERASSERWRSVMQRKASSKNPPHTIAVRRWVNDTDLPGLEIDYEGRTISFDWRAMYTVFFQEEDCIEKKQAIWARNNMKLSHKDRRLIASKQMDAMFDQLEDYYNVTRRDIRRYRTWNSHKADVESFVDNRYQCPGEMLKLQSMRETRAMASFVHFSDEDSE